MKTKESLKAVNEKFESLKSSLAEEAGKLKESGQQSWRDTQQHLDNMSDKLKTAYESLESNYDETKLQGHLAVMEARDKWEELGKVVEQYYQHSKDVKDKGEQALDEAQLQSHLLKLETRDAIEAKSKAVRQQYNESRTELENLTAKSIKEIDSSFETLKSKFTS
ncbi:hypothetical protein K6Y31_03890 [Motilimonas cestriensis]|uniref:Uncharacterized protein n=1 Tax=Motilimonas cestriensis TaxID=2742685 RepID=A0ABS8W4R4_9GAMM|nr:hypothetical protein [Motilimonas cestriensis]MCE2593954.1 hypothetical protein [Motilimonas cestriensis]